MVEKWKWYGDTTYSVSTLGRVRNDRKQIMKQRICGGYYRITLRVNGAKIDKYVSNMVAETFIPNPHAYEFTDHIDMDKLNNCVDNIRWCSNQQNQDYRWSAHYCKRLNQDLRQAFSAK